MPFQEMKIKGAWIHTPIRHNDNRGHFEEQFKHSEIESQLGIKFVVKQVNQSVSNKGVIRGIHYTDSPEGQTKYVSCPKGAIWDIIVDLRKESATYGLWDATLISAKNGKSVFIDTGLGHAFLSLEDGTVANYLCSSEYNPEKDKSINPFDKSLAITFSEIATKYGITDFVLSERDARAVSFYPK